MATQEEIKIVIKAAADQAIRDLDRLNASLGAPTKQQGKLSSFFSSLQKNYMAVAAAAGSLYTAYRYTIGAAAEAEAVQAQLNAVLISTQHAAGLSAEEINRMAQELQRVTTYEDDAIVSAQNLLLTFTRIGKDIFPATTEAVLDMATAMGEDLNSAAIRLGKALQDPVAGATALRRVGVQLSDTQQEQIKRFLAINDVAGAQKIILGELAREFGGSARAAASTFSGQLAQLTNNLKNIGEAVGNLLLPMLREGSANMVLMAGYISIITEKMSKWGVNIGQILGKFNALGPLMKYNTWVLSKFSAMMDGEATKSLERNQKSGISELQAQEKLLAAKMKGQQTYHEGVNKLADELRNKQVEQNNAFKEYTVTEDEAELAALQAKHDAILAKYQWSAEQKAAIDAAYLAKKTNYEQQQTLIEQAFGKTRAQAYGTWSAYMLANLKKTSHAEFLIWRGFAVVQATADAFAAANAALKAMSGIPYIGPALGQAAYWSTLALGMRNVKNIATMQPPKAAEGAFVMGSAAGTTLIAGERGRSEAVVPMENENAMSKLREGLGMGGSLTINVANLWGGSEMPQEVAVIVDRALTKLHRQGDSTFARVLS